MNKSFLGNPFTKFLIGTLCVVIVITIAVFGYLFKVYNPNGLQPLSSSAAQNQYAINDVTNPPTNGNDDGLCREQYPNVLVSPTLQSTYPGGPVQYAITVKNTGCATHSYTVDAKKPTSGWTKAFGLTNMSNVARNQSRTINLTMTSPANISNGSYPIEITVSTVNNNTTLESKATVLYTVANPVIESFTVNGKGDPVAVAANSILTIAWSCENTQSSYVKNNNGYIVAQGGNTVTFTKERAVTGQRIYTLTCFGGPNFTGKSTSKTITVTAR
ncbi:MAG: hypothetical protein IT410_00135 [Candidatus Doudnabacteria bacterium]|nr:hypothetical protein [Candidatus Doudnabacteria bacterium]